jgi:hypothetical protein
MIERKSAQVASNSSDTLDFFQTSEHQNSSDTRFRKEKKGFPRYKE